MGRIKQIPLKNALFFAAAVAIFASTILIFRATFSESDMATRFFPLLLVSLGTEIALALFLTFKQSIRLEKLTLVMLLSLGSIYMFVFPPNSAPDEAVHFTSAYEAMNSILGQQSGDPKTILMRDADRKFYTDYSNFPDMYTYEFFSTEAIKSAPTEASREIVSAERLTEASYPYIYAPQATGFLVARILNLNPEWLYMLGRIFNLVFFALAVWLSIKLAPIGKGVFALVALYPMTLEIAASLSSDVFSLAFAFLALAQYLRIAYGNAPARTRDLILLVATMALLGPPKLVFFSFMLLAFFLPKKRFASAKYALVFRIIVAIVCIAGVALTLYLYLHRGDDGTAIITHGDATMYSLSDLWQEPRHFLSVCKNTLIVFTAFYFEGMVGSEMGWLEISQNKPLIYVFLGLSVAAVFALSKREAVFQKSDRIKFALILIFVMAALAVIMYVSWTPYGSILILGLQGRYFTPLAPLLFFAVARYKMPIRPTFLDDKHLVLINCILQPIILITAFSLIAGRTPDTLGI